MSGAIDEIKARVDLVDLIGRSVQLRKTGAQYKGLCPFHQEKTPSFYVFPDRGTWVCFGCGKKGSAFDWLMEREHLEFKEALEALARMTGVELPTRRDPSQDEAVARLYDALARAQLYYQGLLAGTAGVAARRYLAERGLADETVTAFGLGYAGTGNGLMRYLQDQGFSLDELVAAGLLSIAENGHHFDFFRDRVLFPIRDAQGRTVAFGGRAIGDGLPKYLNSRETLLFHKQETLFALDLARKAIALERRVVVVEGYMDAVTAHQHGYRAVVATLGTAITERHLLALQRVAERIVLALDSDAAGQAATWRALQLAERGLQAGVSPVVGPNRSRRQLSPGRTAQLLILSLPGAKDPDDLIRSDPAAWPSLVDRALPVAEFVLSHLGERHDLASAHGKAEAMAEIAELLAGIANPIEQAHYVQRVSDLLGVQEPAVRQALRQHRRAAPSRQDVDPSPQSTPGAVPVPAAQSRTATSLDEYALALLLQGAEVPLADDGFAEPDLAALHRVVEAGPRPASLDDLRATVPPELLSGLARVEKHVPLLVNMSAGDLADEARRVALGRRHRSLVQRKEEVRALLRDATLEDVPRWAEELTRLAHTLDEIEQALRARPLERVTAKA